MKQLTYLLLFLALPLLAVAQNNTTADAVLLDFLSKIDNQTLTANFTITVTENANQPISYTGKMQMRGDRFRLNMLGNEGAAHLHLARVGDRLVGGLRDGYGEVGSERLVVYLGQKIQQHRIGRCVVLRHSQKRQSQEKQ